FFFFQAEDGIRDFHVTGVQTCALPIYTQPMHYTQLFRNLREAKGLTLEALATRARCHRNTVINVESGRPVKFKTISRLVQKMGYAADSEDMKSVALLWLESASGIRFSQPAVAAQA